MHGSIRTPREGDRRNQRQKFVPLQSIDSINGMTVEAAQNRPQFNKLTPLYPQERLKQETAPNKLNRPPSSTSWRRSARASVA